MNDPDYWCEPLSQRAAEFACNICLQRCDFVIECLTSALLEEDHSKAVERFGIRGGLQPVERQKLFGKLDKEDKE